MHQVATALATVYQRIAEAARKAGRDPSGVRLVAVSKTQPVELVRAAYAWGQRDFGENYVQELGRKAEALADLSGLRWHLIGHVQKNKARHAVRLASVIHTVDSSALAAELGRRAAGIEIAPARRFPVLGRTAGARLPVLVEVNLAGEPEKAGCRPEELETVLRAVELQPALELAGLMAIPPLTEDPEGARPYFEQLVELRERHGGVSRLPELSMGMSHDLEVAVACGATLVRVGTAIFGARTGAEPGA